MSTIQQDLENFHQFAIARLAKRPSVESLDELIVEWRDSQSTDEVNAAIRRGLADIEAGRHEPIEQAVQRIRDRFGFRAE